MLQDLAFSLPPLSVTLWLAAEDGEVSLDYGHGTPVIKTDSNQGAHYLDLNLNYCIYLVLTIPGSCYNNVNN